MYHVVANIDEKFTCAEEALAAYQGQVINPSVPFSAAREYGEDTTTPRICVCENIKACITALGVLGRFRRCLAANEDAKSYETLGIEVYPILILHFPNDLDYYTPDKTQVPDVDVTHERWLLKPTAPDFVQIAWVHLRSIIWEDCGEKSSVSKYSCKSLELIITKDGPIGRAHPWLTGTGHVLDSSDQEDIQVMDITPVYEPWDCRFAYIFRGDKTPGQNPVRHPNQIPEKWLTRMETTPPDPDWQERIDISWWGRLRMAQRSIDDKFRILHELLLAFAGYETCFPNIEPDMDAILQRGQFWYGGQVTHVKGQSGRCHTNACTLWKDSESKDNLAIATGYALSKDGLWRQHSWLLQRKPRSVQVIETTTKRVCYFGFVMTQEEAEHFAAANW